MYMHSFKTALLSFLLPFVLFGFFHRLFDRCFLLNVKVSGLDANAFLGHHRCVVLFVKWSLAGHRKDTAYNKHRYWFATTARFWF